MPRGKKHASNNSSVTWSQQHRLLEAEATWDWKRVRQRRESGGGQGRKEEREKRREEWRREKG